MSQLEKLRDAIPGMPTDALVARLRRLERRDLQRFKTLTWERAMIRRELASREAK